MVEDRYSERGGKMLFVDRFKFTVAKKWKTEVQSGLVVDFRHFLFSKVSGLILLVKHLQFIIRRC